MAEKGRKSVVLKDMQDVELLRKIGDELGIKKPTEVIRFLAKQYLDSGKLTPIKEKEKKGELTKREVISILNRIQMKIKTYINARKGVGLDTTDLEQLFNFVGGLINEIEEG